VKKPAAKLSMHAKIRAWLLEQMTNYGPDEKMPTEFELAERFGVSRLTVHKAMAELQRDGYLIRRRGRGTFVVTRDKRVLGRHQLGANGSLLIAYADWFSYEIWAKVDAAERLAASRGLKLVNYKITKAGMYQSLREAVERIQDLVGAIIIPPGGGVSKQDLEMMAGLDLSLAVLAPLRPEQLPDNVYAVSQDFGQAGHLALSHLAAAGHRTIAYVAGEPWCYGTDLEYAGIKQALYENGLLLRDLKRPDRRLVAWDNSIELSFELTRRMLVKPIPTGWIFDSVPSAMAGIRAIWENAPDRAAAMQCVLTSDYFSLEQYLWPPVSVIRVDYVALLDRAIAALLGEVPEEHRVHCLPVALRILQEPGK